MTVTMSTKTEATAAITTKRTLAMTGTKMPRTITAVTINNYDDNYIADNDICSIKDNGNNWNEYSKDDTNDDVSDNGNMNDHTNDDVSFNGNGKDPANDDVMTD